MAISDEVSIYNLALNAIGARNNVSSPTEKSREAEVCRLWYSVVRDQVLSAAPWPAAKAFRRLAKLADRDGEWIATDPDPNYSYVFSAPEDMLRPRYISNFARFSLGTYPGNVLGISTNEPQPILVYTSRQVQTALWDAQLQMAIVYGLAANICMPLSGKTARSKNMLQQANALITEARESSANAEMDTFDSVPDWILARGYGGAQNSERYIYPSGSALTLASANVN